MFDNIQRITNIFKRLSIEPKDLSGKFALITGGNEGIGFQTALFLAKMNCRVRIVSRSAVKSADAVKELKRISGNPEIDYDTIDLSSFESIKAFGQSFIENNPKLDLLINNAGGLFHEFGKTADDVERSVHINHLGPMLLTLSLLPVIKKTEKARIIFLSSDLHYDATLQIPRDLHTPTDHYHGETVYGKTKLMNVIISNELAKKLSHKDIIVCSLHPGFVATNLGYIHLPDTWGGYFNGLVISLMHKLLARTTEQGAMTSVYAATSDEIVSGGYYDSCTVGGMNPLGKDAALGKQLWEESLKLMGFDDSGIYE